MEVPIHAANEVDKGETMPKVIAGVAGLAIIVLAVVVFAYYSGFWSPPPTSVAATQSPHTQTTQTAPTN